MAGDSMLAYTERMLSSPREKDAADKQVRISFVSAADLFDLVDFSLRSQCHTGVFWETGQDETSPGKTEWDGKRPEERGEEKTRRDKMG
nr:hypothetical protein BaRGS_013641 [Batillaria attramentaria]